MSNQATAPQRDERIEMDDLPQQESETPLLDDMIARLPIVAETFAVAQPVTISRKLADVERRLLEEARLSGEDFYYGWGAGKDAIEGATIKLANALARLWGNCVVRPGPIQELPDAWVFTAYFVDLETGFTMGRQFRQSKKWTVYGRHDEARKDDIRFQIGQSKANRNVILNALPQFLIDRAMKAAKEGVMQKIAKWVEKEGPVKATDLFLKALAKLGVDEARVLARLGIAERKAIGLEELAKLTGDKNAIENGHARAEELFPPIPDAKTADLTKRMKKAKDGTAEPNQPAPGNGALWGDGGKPGEDPAR